MDSLKYQSMAEGLIKSSNVDDVILLIMEVWNQLFNTINFHPLTHKWEVVVRIM